MKSKKIKPLDSFIIKRYRRSLAPLLQEVSLAEIFLKIGADLANVDSHDLYIGRLLREVSSSLEFESSQDLQESLDALNEFYNATVAFFEMMSSFDVEDDKQYRALQEMLNVLFEDLSYDDTVETFVGAFVELSDNAADLLGVTDIFQKNYSWYEVLEYMEEHASDMKALIPIVQMLTLLDTVAEEAKDKEGFVSASMLYCATVAPLDGVRKAIFRQASQTEKIGRNDPCPCGSGKKYKKCCMPR
jgi:preprotein translocase subunit SecA